jgi:hypothetical protein
MGAPTHPLGEGRGRGEEAMVKTRISTLARRAEERQKEEMERIKLGACLGREEYRQAWKEIGGLGIIESGVVLRWNVVEPPAHGGLKRSTVKNEKEASAYRKELDEMLEQGIVEEGEETRVRFFNHTFLVTKEMGKEGQKIRFILDAKQLNFHLIIPHFKLENIGTVLDTIRPKDLMVKFDLKAAYSQVPMAAAAQDYLGFAYEERAFVLRALPFGLATAPCLFTKIMKPVISKLREKYRCGIYLDDGIMIFATLEEAENGVRDMLQLLSRLGLRISFGKSRLVPVRVLEFLGWVIDTERMEVSVTEEKRTEAGRRVEAWVKRAKEGAQVRVRDFSSIIGLLSSMALAVPQAHLRLRLCHQAIDDAVQGNGWDGKMTLDGKLLPGLLWWGERLKRRVAVSLRPFTPTVLVNTDASHYGWGAAVHTEGQRARLGEAWEEEGEGKSSNLRELKAVREAIVGLRKKGLAPGTDLLGSPTI